MVRMLVTKLKVVVCLIILYDFQGRPPVCSQLLCASVFFSLRDYGGVRNRYSNRRLVSSIRSRGSDLTIGSAYQHPAVGEGVPISLCLVFELMV